ncbi:hypothetical protein CARUB_v10025022mg [Capsella rubella]|uniref:Uncharacterized protein n=1 Tax=Capsella rubella TaxID=81985 RepID=R0HTQ3_9BRAS|nr:hypothetical protein CARUB_v10025022mg [Capsella rubella]
MRRKFTDQRNLHRPAITRFATTFIMLAQVHYEEWNNSKWPKQSRGKKVRAYIFEDSFWKNVLYALKLTGPLVQVLRMVDGVRNPPMGNIYAAMDWAM